MTSACPKMRLSSGSIGYRDSGGTGLPIVFVHGVCGSKEVFKHQFAEALAHNFRLIAFDLPGHGASDDASDPQHSYSIRALTDTTLDVMNYLRLPRALIVGWSLGGHIAMELMARFPERLAGVVSMGAPPLAPGKLEPMRGFRLHPDLVLARKAQFTTRDAERWQRLCYGPDHDGMHFAAILRADGRMRPEITRSLLKGGVANERQVVETSPVPLAMINGADDPILRVKYLHKPNYANLWEGRPHLIAGAGHAAFLSHPNSFNVLLHRFASEMARRFPGPYQTNKAPVSVPDVARAAEPKSRQRAAR
jgi:pimeloyl-ACP methyl ester carboxylesterase